MKRDANRDWETLPYWEGQKKSNPVWKWLTFAVCLLVFYALLAPERPYQAIQVLFGLDAIKQVVDRK